MKAIVLLSGGLDSAVILAQLYEQGIECIALSFDYGQRHRFELECAKKIAEYYEAPHEIITVDSQLLKNGSSLTSNEAVQKGKSIQEIMQQDIPRTYVPARNTLFLSFALSKAEIYKAQEIYFGANAMDIKSYPDCRPEYFIALQELFNKATKLSIEQVAPQVKTPLLYKTKKQIVEEGIRLQVPFELTSSCYDPGVKGEACQQCDACILRNDAFQFCQNLNLQVI